MQLEALIRAYHNADMKPGKHVSNARVQVKTTNNARLFGEEGADKTGLPEY